MKRPRTSKTEEQRGARSIIKASSHVPVFGLLTGKNWQKVAENDENSRKLAENWQKTGKNCQSLSKNWHM